MVQPVCIEMLTSHLLDWTRGEPLVSASTILVRRTLHNLAQTGARWCGGIPDMYVYYMHLFPFSGSCFLHASGHRKGEHHSPQVSQPRSQPKMGWLAKIPYQISCLHHKWATTVTRETESSTILKIFVHQHTTVAPRHEVPKIWVLLT